MFSEGLAEVLLSTQCSLIVDIYITMENKQTAVRHVMMVRSAWSFANSILLGLQRYAMRT